ncbi:MAG: hypothetical protein ACLP1Y_13780 [Candidatus Acidiferrales bacterium]
MQTRISCRFLQFLLLILVGSTFLFSQNQPPASDPQAVTLAQQSVAALTGGVSISDVTLNANVTSALGSNSETGTATLRAKGISGSRVDLNLNSGTRSDVRNLANGFPNGTWAKDSAASTQYAQHNCWTDAAWFFPALSSLTQQANNNFVFKYLGQAQHGGVSTQHIQVFQVSPGGVLLFQKLSTMDFYLDSATLLPSAVVFNVHPDKDAGTNIPVEVDFSNYQVVQGVAVPMHIQRYQLGALMLDATVTAVFFNQGLDPSIFSIN